jgi:hypothetical protein
MKLRNHQPDIVVSVGSGDGKEEFECYQLILVMASEVFDAMLSGSMKESKTSRIEFPDKDPNDWKLFYTFINPSTCRDAKINTDNVMKLVPWFHQLQILPLLTECDRVMESYLISKQPSNWHKLTENQFEKLIKWASFSNLYGLPYSLLVAIKQIKVVLSLPHDCVTLQSLKTLLPLLPDNDIIWKVVKEYLPVDASDGPDFSDRQSLSENHLLVYLIDSGIQRKRNSDNSKRTNFERYIYDELQKKGHNTATIDQCLKEVLITITRYKSLQVSY